MDIGVDGIVLRPDTGADAGLRPGTPLDLLAEVGGRAGACPKIVATPTTAFVVFWSQVSDLGNVAVVRLGPTSTVLGSTVLSADGFTPNECPTVALGPTSLAIGWRQTLAGRESSRVQLLSHELALLTGPVEVTGSSLAIGANDSGYLVLSAEETVQARPLGLDGTLGDVVGDLAPNVLDPGVVSLDTTGSELVAYVVASEPIFGERGLYRRRVDHSGRALGGLEFVEAEIDDLVVVVSSEGETMVVRDRSPGDDIALAPAGCSDGSPCPAPFPLEVMGFDSTDIAVAITSRRQVLVAATFFGSGDAGMLFGSLFTLDGDTLAFEAPLAPGRDASRPSIASFGAEYAIAWEGREPGVWFDVITVD